MVLIVPKKGPDKPSPTDLTLSLPPQDSREPSTPIIQHAAIRALDLALVVLCAVVITIVMSLLLLWVSSVYEKCYNDVVCTGLSGAFIRAQSQHKPFSLECEEISGQATDNGKKFVMLKCVTPPSLKPTIASDKTFLRCDASKNMDVEDAKCDLITENLWTRMVATIGGRKVGEESQSSSASAKAV